MIEASRKLARIADFWQPWHMTTTLGAEPTAPIRLSRPIDRPLPPPVRFADGESRDRVCTDAGRARALVIRPPFVRPGELRGAIDADLESALAARGAMPSSVESTAPYRDVVQDQILRAVALPVRGICVVVPELQGGEGRCLADTDAEALGVWVELARSEQRLRLVVLIDDRNQKLAIRVPTSLGSWLGGPPVERTEAPAQCVAPVEDRGADRPLEVPACMATLRPIAPEETDAPQPTESVEAASSPQSEEADDASPGHDALASAMRVVLGPPDEAMEDSEDPSDDDASPMLARAASDGEADRARRLVELATWRAHALELDDARGPRPVPTIEKLFADRYVPLLGAIARGETDRSVEQITDGWRTSFAESYENAFNSLRVTGKRPTMVMDAPEMAHRIGRLASARSVKLVLVDSMSFDVAERVATRVRGAQDKRAALIERNVLWSALPTTTAMQLHLLARGPEGLKEPPAPASQPGISRGRSVATLRRERLGSREVLKLDVVEARLRSQGASYDERLDAVADEVADALNKLLESLPPRTLAYVFGDHGFVLPPGTNGWQTAAATHGGASPEEVLVAGHAWLVDAVQ